MENGKNFDLRSRLQFLIDLRDETKGIYIYRPYNYISTGKLNIFPLSGISNSMTVYEMKVEIISLILAIDMDLTILMRNGIQINLNMF